LAQTRLREFNSPSVRDFGSVPRSSIGCHLYATGMLSLWYALCLRPAAALFADSALLGHDAKIGLDMFADQR